MQAFEGIEPTGLNRAVLKRCRGRPRGLRRWLFGQAHHFTPHGADADQHAGIGKGFLDGDQAMTLTAQAGNLIREGPGLAVRATGGVTRGQFHADAVRFEADRVRSSGPRRARRPLNSE